MKPGALRLEPVCLETVWATEALPEPLASLLGAGRGIGEVWLASDRHHPTAIAEGVHTGRGLDELVAQWPEWICGPSYESGFPLLLKILSVGQWLSVQVHPNDEQARSLEGESRGKSEAWHVLSAEQGAEIVHGVCTGTDRDTVLDALRQGVIPELLEYVPSHSGDTFHIPPGTIHSIGPGLTILEIQQSSDLTYRFFDWNRPGLDGELRELHIEKALKVMNASGKGRAIPPTTMTPGNDSLVSDRYFSMNRCTATTRCHPHTEGPWLLFFYHGCAHIETTSMGIQLAEPGQTWLIPAGLDSWSITPITDEAVFFEAGF